MRTEIKMFFWVESFCFRIVKITFLANKKSYDTDDSYTLQYPTFQAYIHTQ